MPHGKANNPNGRTPSRQRVIVIDFVQRFPESSHKSLARMLMKEHGHAFGNERACETMVRRVRGKQGKASRDSSLIKEMHETKERSTAPAPKLPPAIKRLDPFTAFRIDKPGDWLVLSDTHVPFHDEHAIELAIKEGKRRKVVGILLNGDILDFYRVSWHRKDPRKVDLWEELESGEGFLRYIRHCFPDVDIVYRWGNHEERWHNWMLDRAPELLGVKQFELSKLLKFDEFGIQEVKDKRPIMLGKLAVIHGHEFRRGITAPVSPARGLWLRAKTHCMQGDCHRSSYHPEVEPISRHVWSCYTVGCLCLMDVDFDPLNNWNLGFANVHIDEKGAFDVTNYRVIDGILRT